MAFVMVFSLASAYDKLQTLTSGKPQTQNIGLAQLDSIQSDFHRARSAAGDPSVAFLEFVPWLGADIKATRVISLGLDQIIQSVAPLIEQSDTLELGKSDLPETLKALSGTVDALDTAITNLEKDLGTVKSGELHFGLDKKVEKLKTLVGETRVAVHAGSPLVKTAALLLNQPGKSKWFVATQNASELRASGGLLGSYAVISIENGNVELTDFGADAKLLARGKLSVNFDSGVENVWGADLADWRDLNVSSHVPDDGQIILDAWQEKFNQKLDGVIFFSQGTVAHLLGATGAVTVNGEKLDSSNAVDFLTKDIYALFPNVKTKNNVVSTLMKKLFENLATSTLDSQALYKSLSDTKNLDDVYLWARDEKLQEQIISSGLDGGISPLPGPDVIIGLNNGGGNKLDAYLKSEYVYKQGKCGLQTWEGLPGRQSTVTVTLTNNAPVKGLPRYVNPRLDLRSGQKWIPGSNREVISLYAPVGSTDEQFFVDDAEVGGSFGTSQNHPLYVLSLELLPGQSRTLKVTFIEPVSDQDGNLLHRSPTLRAQRTLGGSEQKVISEGLCKVQ